MAFSQVLFDTVNNVVDSFLEKISSKYNISKQELNNMWSTTQSKTTTPPPSTIPASNDLAKLTRNELSAQCKLRGLKASGTKPELLARLTGGEAPQENTPAAPSAKKSKKASAAKPEPKVINTVQSSIKAVELKKNKFGNFEHSETGFVFDRASHEVIGKQTEDGKVLPLVEEDIEQCNKFKFKYVIPDNLNSKSSKVVVEDIIEEEEEPLEEEILEEEEEVLEEEGEEEELLEDDDDMME